MHIGCAFESGNIHVLDASDPGNVQLQIRPDAGGDHFQWFHFRVDGASGVPLVLRVTNAADASYPKGWEDYRACASHDGSTWFRVDTAWDGKELVLRHAPEQDLMYFAYFAPYRLERHGSLIAETASMDRASLRRLGSTVDGRDLDLLQIGPEDDGRARIWVIGRQHPGETMAEWLIEGLLVHLLDPDEPVSRSLLRRCTFYVVPNMNPDGSARGHLRNNAAGANLNRCWTSPDPDLSPEVFHVRNAMEATGVDFFLDVHGDEALPYNFVSGAEGTTGWNERSAARQARYLEVLSLVNPDFQTRFGYPVAAPGKANLRMATNWVAERFGCLSMTLEQPFKDTADDPQPEGWSPERAQRLGRDQLVALHATLPLLV